jgi:hypothetical protein
MTGSIQDSRDIVQRAYATCRQTAPPAVGFYGGQFVCKSLLACGFAWAFLVVRAIYSTVATG